MRVAHTRPGRLGRLAGGLVLAALAALAGCSTISVSTAVAPGADFAGRKTYAWVPNPQLAGAVEASIAGQEIRAEVERGLAAHGFLPAGGKPPDMLVDYRVILRQELDLQGGPAWGGFSASTYTEGTLCVMIEDPKSVAMLWRGTAQDSVDPRDLSLGSGHDVEAAVQKMFANFPH